MEFKNIKHKSGYIIDVSFGKKFDTYGDYKILKSKNSDNSLLLPCSTSSNEYLEFNANLRRFYNELLTEVEKIKSQKSNLQQSIVKLANNWGYLLYSRNLVVQGLLESHGYKKRLHKAHLKNYDGMKEYKYWKLLLEKVIPSTQAHLKSYIEKNNNQMTLFDKNQCLIGTRVEYKNLHRTSYEVIPTNLLAAITIFSQTQRPRRKKSIAINCAYCKKEITENLGAGRPRVTCSDSCRTLKAKHRKR